VGFRRYPGRFGAVITAMVTPFDDAENLNLTAAVELAKFLERNGSDALVLAGSTGESTSLSDEERLELFEAVLEAVTIPVITCCAGANTRHSIELSKKVAQLNPGGFLVVTPYYIRPPQSGLIAHFRAVAEACEPHPVILYDIPARTGRKIYTETVLRLANEVKNIVAIKDAAGNIVETAKLINLMPDDFELYCGDDSLCFAMASLGASGVISVASHWCAKEIREMMDLINQGEMVKAVQVNKELETSFSFESSEKYPNPMPTKAMLRAIGLNVGQCRLPLGLADQELDHQAALLSKHFIDRLIV
jgi:4-hydroxy-tetrahydrodipicolinate synthase